MSQYDFGNLSSPLSGTSLINTHLEPFRDALFSMHSGSSRPSYAVAGLMWRDTTTNPWVIKMFDGSDDINIGTVNTTTNVFTPAGIALNNIAATANPTVNEDSADGYSVGSVWVNVTLDQSYICVDSSVGAAVWKLMTLTLADVQAGLTMTGKLNTVASATGAAGLNIPHGAAPTSPTNGDFWSTTSALFARINGVTQTLLTLAGGVLTGKLTTLASATGGAGLNLPHGTAPTSPVDGDVWTTTSGLNARINGATVLLGAGNVVKLSTQTASSSASIDFTSSMDSNYTKYILEVFDLVPASAATPCIRVNTGGGYISTATYDVGGAGRDSEGNPVGIEAENGNQIQLTGAEAMETTSTQPNYFTINIINPSHSKRTAISWWGQWVTNGTTRFRNVFGNGSNQTTSPVTGIQFIMTSGNITSGTFILYGVK